MDKLERIIITTLAAQGKTLEQSRYFLNNLRDKIETPIMSQHNSDYDKPLSDFIDLIEL